MMLEVLVLCNFRYEVDKQYLLSTNTSVLVLCNFRYEVDLLTLLQMKQQVLVLCNFRYEVDEGAIAIHSLKCFSTL